MLLRAIISSVVIVGFMGCGDVDYKDDTIGKQTQNTQTDEYSEDNPSTQKSGKQLYNSLCMSCHGKQGEKEALDKSIPIGGQENVVTLYQLKEYKAGRLDQYGMGEKMREATQELSYFDTLLLSKYIETLSLSSNTTRIRPTATQPTQEPTVVKTDIFTKCKGCHGGQGDVKALGKSKIIKDMNKLEIYNALRGYQDGTYGGEMKGLMKGQVAGMSKTELKNLARYIDAL